MVRELILELPHIIFFKNRTIQNYITVYVLYTVTCNVKKNSFIAYIFFFLNTFLTNFMNCNNNCGGEKSLTGNTK